MSALTDLAGQASIPLLAGGLVMLAVLVVLVFIQNLVPNRQPAAGAPAEGVPSLRPLDGKAVFHAVTPAKGRRRKATPERPPLPVDAALLRLLEQKAGEPRLLRVRERMAKIRLYHCAGCARKEENGCTVERDQVRAAFGALHGDRASVAEVRCTIRGDPHCEFEVRH
ncbi:MAG: hypothetical protein QOD77_2126 [Thermoplasmata archaeon]|jgi:hypothetical protein|nr:hypothetical protein [Thermoplasmata archaeon]